MESGEFLRVGSSKVLKTDVRVVAATNVKLGEAISSGKFREDLFYRLNTVPIHIPPLRERKEDIVLLFRKFATDFAEKYRMPPLHLTEEAQNMLRNNNWSGNVRQLKNVTEQISIIEQDREVTPNTLAKYISDSNPSTLPVLHRHFDNNEEHANERELLYKVLFDMKKDMTEMKKLIAEIISATGIDTSIPARNMQTVDSFTIQPEIFKSQFTPVSQDYQRNNEPINDIPIQYPEEVEETLSLEKQEKETIIKALEKHRGRRKYAAAELGISERTLYRKIKEYEIE